MPEQPAFDIHRIIEDARRILTAPGRFYRTMPRTGGFAEPMVFVAVLALATGVIGALLSLVGRGQIGTMHFGLASIILIPIFAIIGSFIGSAVVFLIWKLMGSEQSYETAYRCFAYATAIYPVVTILGVLPYLASIVGVAWFSYLLIEASTLVHRRDRRTATIVFGLIAVLLILSNISAERAVRNLERDMSQIDREAEQWRGLPPEEAGQRLGEFLRGLEQGMGDRSEPER